MKKDDFITMQIQDIKACDEAKKRLLTDVIDCMDLALSQTREGAEIDPHKSAEEAFSLIKKYAQENKCECVGPFEATEKIIAPYLGVSYKRKSREIGLEDIDITKFL